VPLPEALPPDVVDDIDPLPVDPIDPPLMLPPLIDPPPIDPDALDPVEPPEVPPMLPVAPLAPDDPDPPAAPDEPAPPPADPPPADCAITATGARATAAARIMDLRMILSCYDVRDQPSREPGVPASRTRAETAGHCAPLPLARFPAFRYSAPSDGPCPRWQARSGV